MEIDELDNDNNLPLHKAVEQGDVTLVKALLQQGSKTDVLNNQFESPLHIAVKTGNADIIQLLVQHGCDVNICEDFGHATPVHFAVNAINDSELFHKILLILLKGGCMLNWRAYSTLESPFYRAVDLQKSRIAAILLKYGSDPSLGSPFDLTALHKLCQQSNFYLINLVLHCKTNWKRETWLSDDLYSAYILGKHSFRATTK
ncbi:hypothetical protein SNE40_016260 [Patella caerulea]|uniref:Uncharacterized protein n=1 Tax=Patella caerulea TaxID=87958 RepID=A0AAN8PIL1_PATCE